MSVTCARCGDVLLEGEPWSILSVFPAGKRRTPTSYYYCMKCLPELVQDTDTIGDVINSIRVTGNE